MDNSQLVVETKTLPPVPAGQFEMIAPYSQERKAEANRSKSKVTVFKKLKWILLSCLPYYFFFCNSSLLPRQWSDWAFFAGMIGFVGWGYVIWATSKKIKFAPSHIQAGKEGLRFHFLQNYRGYHSSWLQWDSFTSVDLVVAKGGCNKIRFHVSDSCVDQFASMGATKAKPYITIDPAAFTREHDGSNLLQAMQNFMKPEQLDSSIKQFAQTLVPPGYTKMWLQEFSRPVPANFLDPLPPGTMLAENHYKIIDRVGSGGQSVAYKALIEPAPDDSSSRAREYVVLKEFILPVHAGKDVKERALHSIDNESKLLKQLAHRQIVRLVDSFIAGNRAYLSLEYIEGQTLRSLVREGAQLSESQIISFGMQMCGILNYLAQNSIIHRDFTPDNLMVRSDGMLVLIDFNVAQHTESASTREIVGKHSYIPPEQFRGKATVQSDIYAAGCVLHYLCTGKDPIPLSSSHPAADRPGITTVLDAVIAKATAQKLDERFQTSLELQQALTSIRSDAQTETEQYRVLEQQVC